MDGLTFVERINFGFEEVGETSESGSCRGYLYIHP
jgi:hypothetical protein